MRDAVSLKENLKAILGVDLDDSTLSLIECDIKSGSAEQATRRRKLDEQIDRVRDIIRCNSVYSRKEMVTFQKYFKEYFFPSKVTDNAKEVVRSMMANIETKKKPKKLWRMKSLPTFEQASNGLDLGMYVIGADNNVGKTALLVQIAVDLLINNEKAKVLFLSPDDTTRKITRRFIPIVGSIVSNMEYRIPIRYAENYYTTKDDMGNYQRDPNLAQTRDLCYQLMEQWLDEKRLKILSGKMHINDVDSALDEGFNILIADASYKIAVDGRNRNEMDEARAEELKNITIDHLISSVCVKDGRKGTVRGGDIKSTGERVTQPMGKSDIKGSVAWGYEPDFIANMWEDNGAVLFSIQKNKVTGMRKTVRLMLDAECSTYVEEDARWEDI